MSQHRETSPEFQSKLQAIMNVLGHTEAARLVGTDTRVYMNWLHGVHAPNDQQDARVELAYEIVAMLINESGNLVTPRNWLHESTVHIDGEPLSAYDAIRLHCSDMVLAAVAA